MNSDQFKPGHSVIYSGTTAPALHGRSGKVVKIGRNGWVYVDFGPGLGIAMCAPVNLTVEQSAERRAR